MSTFYTPFWERARHPKLPKKVRRMPPRDKKTRKEKTPIELTTDLFLKAIRSHENITQDQRYKLVNQIKEYPSLTSLNMELLAAALALREEFEGRDLPIGFFLRTDIMPLLTSYTSNPSEYQWNVNMKKDQLVANYLMIDEEIAKKARMLIPRDIKDEDRPAALINHKVALYRYLRMLGRLKEDREKIMKVMTSKG